MLQSLFLSVILTSAIITRGGELYSITNRQVVFKMAAKACTELNLSLAHVISQEEVDNASRVLHNSGYSQGWTALIKKKPFTEMGMSISNIHQVEQYLQWFPDKSTPKWLPFNISDLKFTDFYHECVAVEMLAGRLQLVDVDCYSKERRALCKKSETLYVLHTRR